MIQDIVRSGLNLLYCPQCGKGFDGDPDYCPACGYYMKTSINAAELATEFGSVDTSEEHIYWAARDRVAELGGKHGLHAEFEYYVPDGKSESPKFPLKLIDVVWISGSRIVAAFEIVPKKQALSVVSNHDDVNKLTKLNARFKFIANVSKVTGKAYFHRLLENGTIVYAPVLEETPVSEETPSRKFEERPQLSADKLSDLFGTVDTRTGGTPELARNRLRTVGEQLGYQAYSHYGAHSIDVVWLSGGKIAAAFEMRSRRRHFEIVLSRRDQDKLAGLEAQEKFFVFVSRVTGKAYFHRLRADSSIEYAPVSREEEYSYVDEVRKTYPKAYSEWTPEEDQVLAEQYKKGILISELANIHQRTPWAIQLRLEKLGLIKSENISEGFKVGETSLVTFLVKSEKHGKICIACVDENRQWVRPIKPGGFDEKDILMDNGRTIQLFDVVNMKFGAPFPIKHHKENVLLSPRASIRFVRKLGENERSILLSEIANTRILSAVRSREELYDELAFNLTQSLVLVGPISLFDIQCSTISGKTHPRIWMVRENDKQRIFSIPCTDIGFCKFIGSKLDNLEGNDTIISSQDVTELKNKQTYFVIGLTGDSLDEDNRIKDGKYAPPESSLQPRYWPMVVSVLTVPNYSSED